MFTRRQFLGAFGATAATACAPSEPAKVVPPVASAASAATAPPGPSPRRFDVRAFGAVGDGVKDDAPAVAQAIKAAVTAGPGSIVSFPSGRYLLIATSRPPAKTTYKTAPGVPDGYGLPLGHVVLQDARDIVLQGEEGAVLLGHDVNACVLLLMNCRNVVVRSLKIDYDQVLFTQATVTAFNESGNTLDFTVQSGYPDPTAPLFKEAVKWVSIRSAATPDVVKTSAGALGQVFFAAGDIRPAAGGTFRVSNAVRGQVKGIVAGDRLVYGARDNAGGAAVGIYFSEDCTFERVTVNQSPGVTFGQFYNGKLTFRECVIEPTAGSGRLISSLADGFYSKYARAGMVVENCRVTSNHDDGFTVHGQGTRVLGSDGDKITVDRYEFFRAGDEILVLDQGTGRVRGSAKVVDAMLVRWRDINAVQLTLDKAVAGTVSWERLGGAAPLPARLDQVTSPDRRPDLVADTAAIGSGFTIKNSTFEKHLSLSRVYAAKGTIEGNTFDRCGKRALRIGMDLFLPEVYTASALVIRKNTFKGITGESNIRIEDELATAARPALGMDNRDIQITENRFEGFGETAIFVSNAEGVQVVNNEFIGGATDVPIRLNLCRAVNIETVAPIRVSMTAATEGLSVKGPVTTVRG